MTCIVGIVNDGEVIIGGDSIAVGWNYTKAERCDAKVFKRGEMIFGFTSSYRMGQLLRYKLEIPARKPDIDVYEYMVTEFIEAVRSCLKAGGYSTVENNTEQSGTFMVGYAGRLFTIEEDFQVAEHTCGYNACGCGAHIALGAMHASLGQSPKKILEAGLKAAEFHSAGVNGPFVYVETGDVV